MDISEGVELAQLAFHLADKWRNPVLVYGDYLLAHIQEAVDVEPLDFADAAREGLGGRRLARRAAAQSRIVSPLGVRQARASRALGHRAAPAQYDRDEARRDGAARCASRPATSTTPRRWSSRSARRRSSCATSSSSCAPTGEQDRLRAADHALAVPVRRRSRDAADGRDATRRRVRAVRGPDDRRRAPRRARAARRSRSSAGSRPTAPASASGRCSTSRSSASASSRCTKAEPTPRSRRCPTTSAGTSGGAR